MSAIVPTTTNDNAGDNRRIVVRADTSKFLFDDIDRLHLVLKSMAEKESVRNKDVKFLETIIMGRLPEEPPGSERVIGSDWALELVKDPATGLPAINPKTGKTIPIFATSHTGISSKYGTFGVATDIATEHGKYVQSKLDGFRRLVMEFFLQDEIYAKVQALGYLQDLPDVATKRIILNSRTTNLFKASKKKKDSTFRYTSFDCKFVTFSTPEVYNGSFTNRLLDIPHESLISQGVGLSFSFQYKGSNLTKSQFPIKFVMKSALVGTVTPKESAMDQIDSYDHMINSGQPAVSIIDELKAMTIQQSEQSAKNVADVQLEVEKTLQQPGYAEELALISGGGM